MAALFVTFVTFVAALSVVLIGFVLSVRVVTMRLSEPLLILASIPSGSAPPGGSTDSPRSTRPCRDAAHLRGGELVEAHLGRKP